MKQHVLLIGVFGLGIGTVLILEHGRGNHFAQEAMAGEPAKGVVQVPPTYLLPPVSVRTMKGQKGQGSPNPPLTYDADPLNIGDQALANPSHASDADLESLAPLEPAEDEATRLTELREQLSTLAKSKSELLNENALQVEIAKMQREIANLHAARQLQNAQQTLEKLISDFPESPAAGRAKSMLIKGATTPTLQPIPDSNSFRQTF